MQKWRFRPPEGVTERWEGSGWHRTSLTDLTDMAVDVVVHVVVDGPTVPWSHGPTVPRSHGPMVPRSLVGP